MSGARFKLLVKDLLGLAGLELRRLKYVNSEETVLRKLLDALRPDIVLDVGANTGQYANLLRKLGFAGKIVSFEAIPQVHAQLSSAAAADSNWIVAPCAALGSARGTVEFNIAGNSVSSSVLPMQPAHVEAAPDSAYVAKQTVPMERLDELAAPLLHEGGKLLLKIDTQGYEREVLKGSSGLLDKVAMLQLEVSLIPLYLGAPGFAEMIAYVEGMGFELYSIVPGLRNVQSGRLLQSDAFFVGADR